MRGSANERARIRQLRASYRRRMLIVGIIFFILGLVAGGFVYHWYTNLEERDVTASRVWANVTPTAEAALTEATPEPEWNPDPTEATPEPEWNPDPTEATAGAEVQSAVVTPEATEAPTTAPTATPEPVQTAAPTPVQTEAPTATPEPAPTDTPEPTPVVLAEAMDERDPAEEAPGDDYTAAELESIGDEGDAQCEEVVDASTPAPVTEPQVIAIVPFGESYTYETQIRGDGAARLEANDEPYETLSFTQTLKNYMRPSDFADKYASQYRLNGNEAGAGFELVLNNYAGAAAIVPQNVVKFGFESESGVTAELGYQLMDAEIAGNYGVTVTSDTPKMLYKRYQYSENSEEMAYLVVTTYNDGVAAKILFELEGEALPEATPEIIYTTLQKGVRNDDVQAMQERLIELGYLAGRADGDFGNMTEQAVMKAQEAFGMEANGVADNAFQQKLFEGAETTTDDAAQPEAE